MLIGCITHLTTKVMSGLFLSKLIEFIIFHVSMQAILRNLLIRYMHKLEDEADEAAVTQNHLTQLKIDLLKELHHLIPRETGPASNVRMVYS